MGHQHDLKKDPKPAEEEAKNQSAHPFFEPNDITLLSVVTPMLSSNAKQLISFFINFGNPHPSQSPMANLGEIFQQLPAKQKSSLAELAPAVLGMLSNPDNKGNGGGGLNPALISTLLSTLMTTKKEE